MDLGRRSLITVLRVMGDYVVGVEKSVFKFSGWKGER